MLRNLLEIGAYNQDTCLAKLSALVMLQIYGIKEFREVLLREFIYAWNNFNKFEQSAFHTMSLHLFMDGELIKKVIPTLDRPLNPRIKK